MEDTKSNRTRQTNTTADRKVESNDSPEIPDKGETSEIPGQPLAEKGFFRIKIGNVYAQMAQKCIILLLVTSKISGGVYPWTS